MNFIFSITGDAIGGDEKDVKAWLEHSIKQYNNNPEVVTKFKVTVQEVDKDV